MVIVISPTKDPELILRAMRAGAREFVLESDHEELRLAVRDPRQGDRRRGGDIGQVVTIFGAKGGVGGTADRHQPGGRRAAARAARLLVDLDLHLGDVLSFLDVAGTTRSPTCSRTCAASTASCSTPR